MLMIRLQRLGRRHDPSYRVVVTDKAAGPRAGKFVEDLGHYDARLGKGMGKDLTVKADRVKYWLSVGAQTSGTMHNLLVREGVIAGKKRDVRPSKKVQAPTPKDQPSPKSETPSEEVKVETKEAPAEAITESPSEAPVEA